MPPNFVAGNIKKEPPFRTCAGNSLPQKPGQPYTGWQWPDLFLSPKTELQNLSTQLARFPLAGRYHTSPMLQILHCLCCAHQTNPCFHAIPFSPIIDITSDKCVNTKSTISEVKAVPIEILCYRSKICTYMLLIFQTWQNETHTFAKFYFFR